MNSKRKGSAGERELCEYLTAAGFPAHRNEQRYTGGKGNPDIDAEGLEQLHIEVKRVEKLSVQEAVKRGLLQGDVAPLSQFLELLDFFRPDFAVVEP